MRLDRMWLCGAAVALLLAGCDGDGHGGGKKNNPGTGGGGGEGEGGGVVDPPPISAKANVKLKTKDRLIADVAKALALKPGELCRELGRYDCADVHGIALGGVDAYGAGIYEPLKSSAVTTPIAVDRLVLSACQLRAHRDFADLDNAVLFGDLVLSGAALSDVDHGSVGAVIAELYHRFHLREPKDTEVAHLRQLYSDIAAQSQTPAQDWAALSCYAVGTMMESVFY